MKTTVRVILTFIFVAVVGGLTLIIYRSYNYLEADQYNAENVIASDALFVVKSKRTKDIINDNELLSLLFPLENEQKIKSLLREIEQFRNQRLMSHSSFYLSVHAENEKEVLLVLETSKEHNKSLVSLKKYFQENYSESTFNYKNQIIEVLKIDNEQFYLWNLQGLLLFTSSEALMRSQINRFAEKEVISSVMDFTLHEKNTNTRISLSVQYHYFLPYLQKIIRQAGGDQNSINLLEPYRWSVFDIEKKNNHILLSGHTQINNNSQYALLFSHPNNAMDFLKIMPGNANRIFSFAAENSQEMNGMKSMFDLSEDVFALMYPERIITFESQQDSNSFQYLVIHSGNIDEAAFHLYNSVGSSFENNHYLLDTFFIGSSMIGHINLSNFLLTKFGLNQQLPYLSYYTLYDDYIIFTDSKESICHYVNNLRSNTLFTKSPTYEAIQSLSSDKANLFYYIDLHSLSNEKGNYLKALQFQTYMQTDSVFLTNIVMEITK